MLLASLGSTSVISYIQSDPKIMMGITSFAGAVTILDTFVTCRRAL